MALSARFLLPSLSVSLVYSILCHLLSGSGSGSGSGKEASNHTLRPGGPPPIPKSPSKVNTSLL